MSTDNTPAAETPQPFSQALQDWVNGFCSEIPGEYGIELYCGKDGAMAVLRSPDDVAIDDGPMDTEETIFDAVNRLVREAKASDKRVQEEKAVWPSRIDLARMIHAAYSLNGLLGVGPPYEGESFEAYYERAKSRAGDTMFVFLLGELVGDDVAGVEEVDNRLNEAYKDLLRVRSGLLAAIESFKRKLAAATTEV